MGFRRKDRRPEAERTLAEVGVPDEDDEIFLELFEAPRSTAAGTPLEVENNGIAVRVGDAVGLVTTFRTQPTRIVALTQDGETVSTLESFETGTVVLGDEVDLTDVRRSSWVGRPDDRTADLPAGSFLMQVQHVEPRGKDTMVAGPVVTGPAPRIGTRVTCTEGSEDGEVPRPKVLAVRESGGVVELVLKGVRAERFAVGDEVLALNL
jgi:hypothetical protein